MNTEKKFSVIMPVYAGENPNYFKLALSSVFHNNLLPDEILVICDGNLTLELDAVLEQFNSNKNLNILRLDNNQGITNALNHGLQNAKYDIIVRCDSDDINTSNRFEELVCAFDDNIDVIGSFIEEIDERGLIIATKKVETEHARIISQIKFRNQINHMSVAFRKSKVMSAGGYPNIKFKEDYALWINLISHDAKFKNLTEPLVQARVNQDFYTRRGNMAAIKSEVSLYFLMYKRGLAPWYFCMCIALCRMTILMLPAWLLRRIYKVFLRH